MFKGSIGVLHSSLDFPSTFHLPKSLFTFLSRITHPGSFSHPTYPEITTLLAIMSNLLLPTPAETPGSYLYHVYDDWEIQQFDWRVSEPNVWKTHPPTLRTFNKVILDQDGDEVIFIENGTLLELKLLLQEDTKNEACMFYTIEQFLRRVAESSQEDETTVFVVSSKQELLFAKPGVYKIAGKNLTFENGTNTAFVDMHDSNAIRDLCSLDKGISKVALEKHLASLEKSLPSRKVDLDEIFEDLVNLMNPNLERLGKPLLPPVPYNIRPAVHFELRPDGSDSGHADGRAQLAELRCKPAPAEADDESEADRVWAELEALRCRPM